MKNRTATKFGKEPNNYELQIKQHSKY